MLKDKKEHLKSQISSSYQNKTSLPVLYIILPHIILELCEFQESKMLKFARKNRSSSVDRSRTNNCNDKISVSSLSPRVKVSSPGVETLPLDVKISPKT